MGDTMSEVERREAIRVGIVGYGNLGRGAELALHDAPDMRIVGIFTRREPEVLSRARRDDPAVADLADETAIYPLDSIRDFESEIDLLLLCGGSRSDLPEQGPALARYFNTVDSFDIHSRIPEYHAAVDAEARAGDNLSIVSVGWDPGLFSLNRLYAEAVLSRGKTYTFWGKGLSQGHSEAVRRVPGVKAGVQYTIPSAEVLERVRAGERPELGTRERHRRECYVVLDQGADAAEVERAIRTMPDYFEGYETEVHFITEEELSAEHSAMPHGGNVIRGGETGLTNNAVIEFSLRLESNPEFTASVLVAYGRAAFRLYERGERGARTVLDIPPALLSPRSPAELMRELL